MQLKFTDLSRCEAKGGQKDYEIPDSFAALTDSWRDELENKMPKYDWNVIESGKAIQLPRDAMGRSSRACGKAGTMFKSYKEMLHSNKRLI